MPQRDTYHKAVKNALVKDGWVITHDPLLLSLGQRNIYVDLGAELPLAAEKDGRKIAVEVKSFVGASEITELERAVGQYALYRYALGEQEPGRVLYLAIPRESYASLFADVQTYNLIPSLGIRVIVFDAPEEVIVQWIE